MNAFVRWLDEPLAASALVARVRMPATIVGDPGRAVRGVTTLAPGCPDALGFCEVDDAGERIGATLATIVVVTPRCNARPRPDQTLLVAEDPRAWFIEAVDAMLPGAARPDEPSIGIHPSARVHPLAAVAPGSAIGAGVDIGARTRIGGGVVIYAGCRIGADCNLGAGTVIGGVGLAYHDGRDGRRRFFPHLAAVAIGDRVDVGGNATICRGMLANTTIGDDAKLGSLVYVGHGAAIGERTWISASSAIAGHARIGAGVLVGIGTVVSDNVAIGDGAIVGAGSVVTRDAEQGAKVIGVPARDVPMLRRFGPTPR